MKPGDIAKAVFGYPDQTGAKKRPVLVVSSEDYNSIGDVVIAAISSKPLRNKHEYEIQAWKSSGLRRPSKVKTGTLHTVSGSLIRKIGQLPEEEYLMVKQYLSEVFGLNIN